MDNSRRRYSILIAIAAALYISAVVLTIYAGVNPLVSILWNAMAALQVFYAELLPLSAAKNPLIVVVNIIDVIIFALIALFLATEFLTFLRSIDLRERLTFRKIKSMKDHVIIAPYNSFANTLINDLFKEGRKDIVVITESQKYAHALSRMGVPAVVGKAGAMESFALSGAAKAKFVLACGDADLDNALISVTAKSVNSKLKVISRVNKRENIPKLSMAGAYMTVLPEIEAGRVIGAELIKRIV
ncbi:MAG: NAD-binding protein [Candidatus Marsarchaeota archaeon]|nr:NAD-binding protein [Candidatus Marsarchaeota archaeon]MCL5112767.1 NAD-binding protein [Candidatus Marsarchaeota archaeon]